MAIADDIKVDLTNQIIKRRAGASSTKYQAKELYFFLEDMFDEPNLMNCMVPMSRQTETSFAIINKWYIQEELTKYITSGSIQTLGYLNEIRTLVCDHTGWIDFVADDIGNTIVGDVTGNTGTILDHDNNEHKIWIRMNTTGDIFSNATESYTQCGIGTATAAAISITGETCFANLYTISELKGTRHIDIFQGKSRINQSVNDDGHIDTLVKITDSGVDINDKKITLFDKTKINLSCQYNITAIQNGQNVIPIGWEGEMNNNEHGEIKQWR
jgi:hypothetical protein